MGNSVHILTPVRKGGPWKWGATLAEHLNKRGHWRAVHIHALPKVLLSPVYQGCDIVHTAIPVTHRLWRKPVVLTIRGDYRRDNNVWSGMYPTAVKMADVVTVSSQFMKDELGIVDAVVIPPAVDVCPLTPSTSLRTGLSLSRKGRGEYSEKESRIRLLTVTNFHFPEKAKGVLKIVNALSALKSMNLQITLSILGDGQYRKNVAEEIEKLGVPVQFHGFTDPKPFLQSSDIFVYWSDHDNTPIALLEAMSYGLPVVTNAVGAVPEMVRDGETGLVAGNEKDYKDKISMLLSDAALRDKLGQAVRADVIQRFSHDVITPQYEAIYQKLI